MLEEEQNLFSPHKSPKQSTVSCLSCLLLETIQRNTTTGISSRQVFVNRWVFVNWMPESHSIHCNSSKLNTVVLAGDSKMYKKSVDCHQAQWKHLWHFRGLFDLFFKGFNGSGIMIPSEFKYPFH